MYIGGMVWSKGSCLRRVDHHCHSGIAMTNLGAVDPDRICISDRDFENIAVLSTARAEGATVDASRQRLTRGGKRGLSDGMPAWIEVKDHCVSSGSCQGVWTEYKSILPNVNIKYSGECCGRKESEESKSAHVEKWMVLDMGVYRVECKCLDSVDLKGALYSLCRVNQRTVNTKRNSGGF